MTRALKRTVRAVVLVGVISVAFAAPATAAPPCWKSLLNDWYDGTINKTYAIPCYQQAINHLPTDAQLYSSAKEDILNAMTLAIAAQKDATKTTTAATQTTAPPPTTTSSVPTQTATEQTTTEAATTETSATPLPTTSPGRPPKKGIPGAIDDPGSPDSFPLPLVILGGLALLLVAAGVGGMIWRRGGGPTAS